jgi:CRISPR-associated endonuclease/helicase Cas3
MAGLFSSFFKAREWGHLAGLWHDLGKYKPEFQDRLRGSGQAVEHAGIGAALASSKDKDKARGLPLAFVIAGHHAGLADLSSTAAAPGRPRPLQERLKANLPALAALQPALPLHLASAPLPALPDRFIKAGSGPSGLLSFELWVRFLFSCLVDADSLATEDFYTPGHRQTILAGYDDIPALSRRLDEGLDRLVAESAQAGKASRVNRRRAEILDSCRKKAAEAPGLFSLTVPTGGGKTLSAMSFALRHASAHELRRVIVAIPFTSIIEQNARVYCEHLGELNVIEHHSGIDPVAAEEAKGEAEIRRRLAAENWDAPVIVTTNVQFFESLFAASRSRCRKLHNVAKSVILLDEPQSLPAEYLLPVLDVIRDLVTNYGCSVLFTTATQPALSRRESFPQGLTGVTEIIQDPGRLAQNLERVTTAWPQEGTVTTYAQLALELTQHDQILAVVHLRKDARTLAEGLPQENRFHLSALMCAAHRTEILGTVRQKLRDRLPCRLVSTQLIEAGVDVDFPLVYRCLGGLDSLAQAAGRCNREGRLPHPGKVVYFRAETQPPQGILRKGLEVVESMLRERHGSIDLSDPRVYDDYFRQLYLLCDLDARHIQMLRQGLNFATVDQSFRLIDDASFPVVVPFGRAEERLRTLRLHGPDRLRLRALQPFVVNIRERAVSILRHAGALEQVAETVYALVPAFHHLYDPNLGLLLDDDPQPDPASYIV